MSRKLKTIYFLPLVLFISIANADVYQWKDETGKVHFGDGRGSGYDSAEKVEIKDKYLIPGVSTAPGIHYMSSEPHRQISIESLELDLVGSEHGKVRIGRVTCGKPIDVFWLKGRVDLASHEVAVRAQEAFTHYGYNVVNRLGQDSHSTNLQLEGSIKSLKMNQCPSVDNRDYSQNGTYLKIHWRLRDPIRNEVLFSQITEGSHNALGDRPVKKGELKSFQIALEQSVLNLVGIPEFSEILKPISIEALISKSGAPISLNLKIGRQNKKFHEEVGLLKSSAVIVETEEGHGSGVIVDSKGYVLTNAHVIANAEKITIKLNRKNYRAAVVRKEAIRDVALLKTERPLPNNLGVRVGSEKPNDGDDIFVIGTPLSLEHAHSISRGIVSARRRIEGLEYIQTDASVNPGNSGGPVFDQYGELVALTVSGLFTRDGANVGISYLIPIADALNHLNIVEEKPAGFGDQLLSDASSEDVSALEDGEPSERHEGKPLINNYSEDLPWYQKLYAWLDSPLFYF